MTTKKTKGKAKSYISVANVLPPREMLAADEWTIEVRKLDEIAELVWMPEGLEKDARNARLVRALELYADLKPVGSAEGMLAAQMVGTHHAALDCLRRAAIVNQTFEGRNMALNHAQKLMALYTKQLAVLDKHRGKGQQKVTVEHVNVHSGGQAIVGNVEMADKAAKIPPVPALEEPTEVAMQPLAAKPKSKVRR